MTEASPSRKAEPSPAAAIVPDAVAGHPPGGASTPVELNTLARQVAEQFRHQAYPPTMIPGMTRIGEFLLLAGAGAVATMAAGLETQSSWHGPTLLCVSAALLAIFCLQLADAYQRPALRAAMRTLPRVLGAWTLVCALTAPVPYLLLGEAPSVRWLAIWFCTGLVALAAGRFLLSAAIGRWARKGLMERRVVIVGGGEPAKTLIRALETEPEGDIRICGIFDDRKSSGRSPDVVAGYPKLGTFAELVEFGRATRIDMLIIALPLSAEERIMQLLRKLWVLPVDIRLAAHANNLRFRPRNYSHLGDVRMLDIFDKPIADWDSVAKRTFDIVFTIVALCLLWPVMIGAAIAVKLSSAGPVFFKQKRHGFNNQEIDVFKFRSMYTDRSDPTAKRAVTRGDPRVTPVGRVLRKTSIDELPQLFNVLRGELSLVGPRPHAVAAQTADLTYVDIVESYFARHRVKPGVTGWAQINGWRGEIDSDDKIRFRTAHDLYYIENWSLWFDLKILFLTPFRLLNTENAY